MSRIIRGWVLVVLGLFAALPAAGQGAAGAIDLPISLPGGITADLTVSFESVTGLSLANLGVAVQLISPNDPGLLTRLPGTASIPAGFPVLVRIEPPASGGLSFNGIALIQLHTHNLQYVPHTPLRLFAAPLGGAFADITDATGAGSYRVSGSKGGFSEFLIVVDLTSLNRAVLDKFDRLRQLLTDNADAIPGAVRNELSLELAAARADYLQGNTEDAIHDVDLFLATVRQHSGTDIPDVWRAARDLVDVAGLLRAGGRTLRFSLTEIDS